MGSREEGGRETGRRKRVKEGGQDTWLKGVVRGSDSPT